jgi:hypothetical protein
MPRGPPRPELPCRGGGVRSYGRAARQVETAEVLKQPSGKTRNARHVAKGSRERRALSSPTTWRLRDGMVNGIKRR